MGGGVEWRLSIWGRAWALLHGLCHPTFSILPTFIVSSPQESKHNWETLRRPRSNGVAGRHKEAPWLVSVPGVCQGVLLNRWWVLSTASCLRNVYMPKEKGRGDSGGWDSVLLQLATVG